MIESKKRPLKVILLLILLPLWLVGSGGGALWYYFHLEKKQALVQQERFTQAVSASLMADDLRKLVSVIGERNTSSPAAAASLSRTASMIEGLLGPSNTGYQVKKTNGPAALPILQVSLTGKNPEAAAIWIVTSYDSRVASRGAEGNATGLAATLAAAQALAGDTPQFPLHFIFLPHSQDLASPVQETATQLQTLITSAGPPKAVLCVETMGAGESLWLTTHDSAAVPLSHLAGLGAVYTTDVVYSAGDADLASRLFKLGIPAVRVATRTLLAPQDSDDQLPFAPTVAAATGRLIELIRRCDAK